MAKRYYNLPSLKMLATFECASRSSSFKNAAAELNVTISAISHQTKSLEKELGFKLFERGQRPVLLTPEGQHLKDMLSASFTELSALIDELKARNTRPQLTIGATTAVSSLWLTPRITKFWREFGDVTVNQFVRDRPFVRPLEPDMVIEYVLKKPVEQSIKLFDDTLLPLVTPGFKQKDPIDLQQLAQGPLIHLVASETNWTSWPSWFKSLGYNGPINMHQRVNNYTIALQLAQDGVGIVLGWNRLVAPLLKRKQLTPYSSFKSKAPGSFFLVYKADVENNADVVSFSEWLIENKS